MEESNKTVEGEQTESKQNELQKETTDPYMNKKPVVGKARSRTSGTRTLSKPSATSPSKSRSSALIPSNQASNNTQAEIPVNKNTSATKAVPSSSTSKANVLIVPDEITSPDREQKKETEHMNQKSFKSDHVTGNKKSTDGHKTKGDTIATTSSKAEKDLDQRNKQRGSGKDLKTLKKKAEKSEKKVTKLKKKFKKAKKNEVKKSMLKLLKDKIIKAVVKLKRRMKKLKKAKA